MFKLPSHASIEVALHTIIGHSGDLHLSMGGEVIETNYSM